MARPLRIQYEGAFYHVTSRGDRRGKIFLSDTDRRRFLDTIHSSKKRYGFIVHAFVLMDNHYHLLIETPQPNLSAALRHINGSYTLYFNRKHGRVGHVLQGRYKAIVVEKDEYYLELIRYIHLNPVRAGMVNDPDKYHWSSHAAIIDKRAAKEWSGFFDRNELLRHFGKREREAIKAYRSFVVAGMDIKKEDAFNGLSYGYILGQTGFVDWVLRNYVDDKSIDKEIQGSKAFKKGFGFDDVLSVVESAFNVRRKDIIGVRRGRLARNEARLLAMHLLARYSTMTQREIGELFGGVSDVAVSKAARQCDDQMNIDKRLRTICTEIIELLRIS